MTTIRRALRNGVLHVAVLAAVITGGILTVVDDDAESSEVRSMREQLLAEEKQIATCMEDRGFDYVAEVPKSFDAYLAHSRGYEQAADEAMERETRNEKYGKSLPPSERRRYVEGHTACAESVQNAKFNDAKRAEVKQEHEAMTAEMAANGSVKKAGERWLDCMADHGVDIELPDMSSKESQASALPAIGEGYYRYQARERIFGPGEGEGGGGVDASDPRAAEYDAVERSLRTATDECNPPYYEVFETERGKAVRAADR